MRAIGFVALLVCVGASGCRREHLIEDFGSSYAKAFAAQQERGAEAPADVVRGLDSQEAAITADNYRGGLAPKGEDVKEEPVVIVAPPSRERAEALAPSVPKE